MCERLSFYANRGDIADILDLNVRFDSTLLKSYSLKPGDYANILIPVENNVLVQAQWGILQNSGSYGQSHIDHNGIETKSTYRIPLRTRRSIVFLDAFYTRTSNQEVLRVFRKNQGLLMAAVLYEYSEKDDEYSFSLLIEANYNSKLNPDIKRTPMLLESKEEVEVWLNQETTIDQVKEVLYKNRRQDFNYYNIDQELYRNNIATRKLIRKKSHQYRLF